APSLRGEQLIAAGNDYQGRVLSRFDARLDPGLHIGGREQPARVARVLRGDLIFHMESRDAGALVAAREKKSIGPRLPERIGIGDQRNVDGRSYSRGLLDLLHLREDSVIGNRVVERAAGVSTQVGGLESNSLYDPTGERAVGISGNEMLTAAD